MRYTYDAEVDALYLYLSDAIVARTVEVTPSCMVDIDAAGRPVGVEVLRASHGWPIDEVARRFMIDRELFEVFITPPRAVVTPSTRSRTADELVGGAAS